MVQLGRRSALRARRLAAARVDRGALRRDRARGALQAGAARRARAWRSGRSAPRSRPTCGAATPHLVMLEGEGPVWMEEYAGPWLCELLGECARRLEIPLRRGFRARASTDSVIPAAPATRSRRSCRSPTGSAPPTTTCRATCPRTSTTPPSAMPEATRSTTPSASRADSLDAQRLWRCSPRGNLGFILPPPISRGLSPTASRRWAPGSRRFAVALASCGHPLALAFAL
jgi:hypothetical protein